MFKGIYRSDQRFYIRANWMWQNNKSLYKGSIDLKYFAAKYEIHSSITQHVVELFQSHSHGTILVQHPNYKALWNALANTS